MVVTPQLFSRGWLATIQKAWGTGRAKEGLPGSAPKVDMGTCCRMTMEDIWAHWKHKLMVTAVKIHLNFGILGLGDAQVHKWARMRTWVLMRRKWT